MTAGVRSLTRRATSQGRRPWSDAMRERMNSRRKERRFRPSTLQEPQGRPEPSRGATSSGRPELVEGRGPSP